MSRHPSPAPARAIADVSSGIILASVEIAVPVERVFQAITRGDEIVRWWGSPDTYRTTHWESDLRPGGRWTAGGVGADGKPFAVGGEILEVDPPRKLVQTWTPDWDGGHVTTVTYRLEPIPGGTRLTLRHEGFGDRTQSCAAHGEGWEHVFGWLAGHFTASPPAPAQYFLVKLLPPRPSFTTDMTPAEMQVMQEHVGYWTGMLAQGKAIVFGPVADPQGGWGLGVLRVAGPDELQALLARDPATLSGRGFRHETLAMLRAVHA